jgi:hypothetical protein
MQQMLRQRVDPDQRVVGPGAVPFGAQLVLVLARPFENEPEGARVGSQPSTGASVSIAISAKCSP